MNSQELRAEMVRHGDNLASLAEALGKSYPTTLSKVNGKICFTQPEIQIIILRYNLTAERVMEIFFTPKVA